MISIKNNILKIKIKDKINQIEEKEIIEIFCLINAFHIHSFLCTLQSHVLMFTNTNSNDDPFIETMEQIAHYYNSR